MALEASVIQIGTYSPRSNSWLWAWANTSVLPQARQAADRIRELHALTGMKTFAHDHAFPIEDESMAWDLAALAVKHLSALGCYRAPSAGGGPTAFLALLTVHGFAPNDRRPHAPQPTVSKPDPVD